MKIIKLKRTFKQVQQVGPKLMVQHHPALLDKQHHPTLLVQQHIFYQTSDIIVGPTSPNTVSPASLVQH